MIEKHYPRRAATRQLHQELMAAFGDAFAGIRVNETGVTVFLTEDRPDLDVRNIVEGQDLAILNPSQDTVEAGSELSVEVWVPYSDQTSVALLIGGKKTASKDLDESKRATFVIPTDANLEGVLHIDVPGHVCDAIEIPVVNSASNQVVIADVSAVEVTDQDGKIHVAPSSDSMVRIDELVASIKNMRDKRAELKTVAASVQSSWSGASAGEKAELLKATSVALYNSVQGLTNIVAWLVRQELNRQKEGR